MFTSFPKSIASFASSCVDFVSGLKLILIGRFYSRILWKNKVSIHQFIAFVFDTINSQCLLVLNA